MSRFIHCIVTGDLFQLVKHGTPTDPLILHNTWSNILTEYSEAIGNSEYKLYVKLKSEVGELKLRYESMKTILDMLQPGIYSKFLCECLNKELGSKYKFDYTSEKSYQRELNGCNSKIKSFKLQLQFKENHLQTVKNKQQKGDPPSYQYYDSIIISLEDHSKNTINPDIITVSKFCERLKRLTIYIDNLNNVKK